VDPASLPEWIALLRQSNVRWLRERNVWGGDRFDPGIRERLETLRAAGFNIVAFAGTPSNVTAQLEGNQLPEDLLAVYASGFRQGREYAGLVSAWELTGEPDVGYCRDLPDRLAAYNKAMYLGLKSGAAAFQSSLSDKVKVESRAGKSELNHKLSVSTRDERSPIVLMGALALPPGPWLERAADNGLFDYTDAHNFHYYGSADKLTAVIRAQRDAMNELSAEGLELTASRSYWLGRKRGIGLTAKSSQLMARQLPLWLTECGLDAIVPGDFLNAERRELQAEFMQATARQSLAARDLAVFMPFILIHKEDPFSMTLPSPPTPLPAWNAYAKYTRETEWPQRVLSVPAGERANPVVVQWMPAAGTETHKVAGTYRLWTCDVMAGEFRIYNFGDRAVEGQLKLAAGLERLGTGVPQLTVPSGGCVTVPVIYKPNHDIGYFREWLRVEFCEKSGRVSPVAFGVERRPEVLDFTGEPVALYPLRGDSRLPSSLTKFEGKPWGSWRVFNGLEAGVAERIEDRRPVDRKPDSRTSEEGGRTAGQSEYRAAGVRFSVATPVNDPLAPAYALAALRGVPEGVSFLRLRLDRPMVRNAAVRVDLVDVDGERFTIWENLGNAYGESSNEVWLALADFHPYFWSKAVAGNRRLRTDKVREIGLRFYLSDGGSMDVEMEWMRALSAR
jgi:hypothetical protein